jgi:hypothetical protein
MTASSGRIGRKSDGGPVSVTDWTVIGAVAAIIGAAATVKYLRVYLTDRHEVKAREATEPVWKLITMEYGETVLKERAKSRGLKIGWPGADHVEEWRSQHGWSYFEELEHGHPVRYHTRDGSVLVCKPAPQ